MKRKYLLVSLLCIIVVLIFLSVINVIEKKQNTGDKSENLKDIYIGDEILPIKDAYKQAGADEITYVAAKLNEGAGNLDEQYKRVYYFENADVVKEVVSMLDTEVFKVGKKDFEVNESSKACWELWLGFEEDKSLLLTTNTVEWENGCEGKLLLAKPGQFVTYRDDFMSDIFEKGIYFDDKLTEVLTDIIVEQISDIKMEDIDEILQQDNVKLRSFMRWYYEEGKNGTLGETPFYVWNVENGGRLEVYYSTNKEAFEEITEIIYYENDADTEGEVLYKRGAE